MKRVSLNLDIDTEVDAAYIELARPVNRADRPAQIVVEDPRLKGMVVLDVNRAGHIVGLEFIGVRSMLPRLPHAR